MYDLVAAIAFLTRLPVGKWWTFDAADVARAGRWFPLVGAVLGGMYIVALWMLERVFPSLVAAAMLVALDALLTGALHLDGLADTADGFGGGKTRNDVLRIMRDHAIGSYGAVALILVLVLKIGALGSLIETHRAATCLFLAPALARWTAVFIGATQPYARPGESEKPRFGRTELVIASITAVGIAAAPDYKRGLAACACILAGSAFWAWRCRRRIGGFTGDTLGACIAVSECFVLLFFTAWR